MHAFVSTTLDRGARLVVTLAVLALAGSVQAQTLTTLYSFTGTTGSTPVGNVVFGANGSLFGTTADGGVPGQGQTQSFGTIFELTPGTPWTETVLHSFQGGTDGATPNAALIAGTKGVFYGTTIQGGNTGSGTVFQLLEPTVKGGAWTETVIYNFAGNASGMVNTSGTTVTLVSGTPFVTGTSWNGLTLVIDGTSYTVASVQSSTSLTLTSGPGSNLTNVFYQSIDGAGPMGSLTLLSNGKLYGTTSGGGGGANPGGGTVFQLTPPAEQGGAWTEQVIYSFQGGKDGSGPEGPLLLNGTTLFGTTCCGQVGGTAFSLAPPSGSGSSWTKTTIFSFTSYSQGKSPVGGLAINSSGVLYGTTVEGGAGGAGIVFSLTPPTTKGKPYVLNTIHSFSNAGFAEGTVNVSGTAVTLASGDSFVTGPVWVGDTIQINGKPYTVATVTSTTALTLSKSAGTQTGVSYSLDATLGGGTPYGSLLLGSSGQLYATVTTGCAYGGGGVLELTPPTVKGEPWTETVLYSFMGAADGSEPFAGVTLNNNALYGATAFDGADGDGTVFELTLP